MKKRFLALGALLVLLVVAVFVVNVAAPDAPESTSLALAATSTPQVTATTAYSATVTWAGISMSKQSGFYVLENGTRQATVSTSTRSYIVAGLTCGQSYTFTVEPYASKTVGTAEAKSVSYMSAVCPGSTATTTTSTATTTTATATSTGPTTTSTTATTPTITTSTSTTTTGTTPPPSGPVTCSLNATTTSFASQVAAATPGQTVCLAAGNYGDWTGTSKAAPGLTITTQPGAAVTLGFNFYLPNVQNVTVDGGANGGSISTPNGSQSLDGGSTTARNITLQNISFIGNAVGVDVDDPTNSNIVFNHDEFSGSDCLTAPGGVMLHLSYSASAPSGVTVENSIFENGSSDGIQGGTAMTITNNLFENVIETSAEMSTCHTDAIQFDGMTGGQTVIEGNWFINTSDGIGSWNGDSAPGYVIENNVFDHQKEEAAMALHLDNGSIVEHNTCIDPGDACLDLTGLSNEPSVGTVIKDNVFDAKYAYNLTAAKPATQANNMIPSGATGLDFTGTPTFVGGSIFPFSSLADYQLTTNSAGHAAGDDGADVGAGAFTQIAYGPQASG